MGGICITVHCDYCGREAEYVDSKVVYGRSYGMIYLCRPCDAYVGVHKGSDKPKGRLADKELRYWKKAAHAAFDPLWKSRIFTRHSAYIWLSQKLGILPEKAHIGMFDIALCKQVIELSNNEMKGAYKNGRY